MEQDLLALTLLFVMKLPVLALQIVTTAVPVLLAITLHETAHGYVARHFGDPTAERAGRITLNPLRHIDPVGTILVPLGILLMSSLLNGHGLLFGWAKPVPVNFGRLRKPKADMLWVAAAGPGVNFLMALFWAALYGLVADSARTGGVFLYYLKAMAVIGLKINGALMILNLLPIPPLDGGRIVVSLLPNRLAWQYSRIEPYGMPIILVLLLTGALGSILAPPMNLFHRALIVMFVR
jgi:Zn-dependent protease